MPRKQPLDKEGYQQRSRVWHTAPFLYAYSFLLVFLLDFFNGGEGGFYENMSSDNVITSISAKLALTPYYWEDSRVGCLTSYLMHPFAHWNEFYIYSGELFLKAVFIALLPVTLLYLSGKKRLGYVFIPLFYVIAFFFNEYTRRTVGGGLLYYYFPSFALFFIAQIIDRRVQTKGPRPQFYLLCVPILLLCMVAYWVNLSLFIFAMPYLVYLVWRKAASWRFLLMNGVAYVPPFLLSHAVEIWGKSYTQLEPSFSAPYELIKTFFFYASFVPAMNLVLCVLTVITMAWVAHRMFRTDKDIEFTNFFVAVVLGLCVFWLLASQLWYVKINLYSGRYLNIAMILVAFLVPMATWILMVRSLAAFGYQILIPKIHAAFALACNLLFLGMLAGRFELPHIIVPQYVLQLMEMAKTNKASAIIYGEDTSVTGREGYNIIWTFFFHSLIQNQSMEKSILPIASRCTAIMPQIEDIITRHEGPFRALCLGGDTRECLKRTAECGFLDFSERPKVVDRKIMGFLKEPLAITTLEFAPANAGNSGNLLTLLGLHEPARLTPAGHLYLPAAPGAYTATYGPYLALDAGDYRLSVSCTAPKPLPVSTKLADLKIMFNEKRITYKEVALSGTAGFQEKDLVFSIPYSPFYTPRLQFFLTSSGTTALDCSEFRISRLTSSPPT